MERALLFGLVESCCSSVGLGRRNFDWMFGNPFDALCFLLGMQNTHPHIIGSIS